MDMSFLLKSFLPPGVEIEQVQKTGLDLLQRLIASSKRIDESHALLLEQNAMLRQIIALSQAPTTSFQQEAQNATQTHAAPLHADEPSFGGGNRPIGPDTASAPGTGTVACRPAGCGSPGVCSYPECTCGSKPE